MGVKAEAWQIRVCRIALSNADSTLDRVFLPFFLAGFVLSSTVIRFSGGGWSWFCFLSSAMDWVTSRISFTVMLGCRVLRRPALELPWGKHPIIYLILHGYCNFQVCSRFILVFYSRIFSRTQQLHLLHKLSFIYSVRKLDRAQGKPILKLR